MNKKNTKRTFSQAKPKSSSAFSLPEKPLVSLAPFKLEIEKLTFSGDGLSRKDGLVYFVPFTAAGDVISAQIFEKKKNFARAEVLEVAGLRRQEQSLFAPFMASVAAAIGNISAMKNSSAKNRIFCRSNLPESLINL